MSQSTNSPESSAVVSALETLIDSRIASQQPTTEELARAVAELIEIPDPEPQTELTEEQLAQVRQQINAQLPDTDSLSDGQIQQVIGLIGEHAPAGDGSTGGSEDPFGEEYRAKVDKEILRQRVSSDPTHKSRIETGTPSGDYHNFGDWGNIITVHEPVHWESAVIDAQEEGMTRLRIREIDFEEPTIQDGSYVSGGRYELGEVKATRDLHHGSGPQEIYPEIVLFPGQYFIDRDPEAVVPMRKVATGVNFDDFNANHRVPVDISHSWRAVQSYTPGGDSYESPYLSSGWHNNIYYFGNLEFGFMGDETVGTNSYGGGSYETLSYGGHDGTTAEGDPIELVDPIEDDETVEKGG